jgi:DNA-binding response OmpR family regulator
MKKECENILKKTTILLVEDNVELRRKFRNVLNTYVEKVYEASNGEEAVEIFSKFTPTILITDFKMPVMDGLELVTFVRRVNKDMPIVVISAHTDIDALVGFTSLHLIQYLIKPIDFEQLNIVLEKCAKELLEKGLIEVKLNDNNFYSFSQKCIIKDGENISLSPNEIKFLELLIENKKKLVTMDMIEYEVYNNQAFTNSALNNLVSKLRKKTGITTINNIPRIGFILVS